MAKSGFQYILGHTFATLGQEVTDVFFLISSIFFLFYCKYSNRKRKKEEVKEERLLAMKLKPFHRESFYLTGTPFIEKAPAKESTIFGQGSFSKI